MILSSSLSQLNSIVDYLPLFSTFVGLSKIFQEYVILPLSQREGECGSRDFHAKVDLCRSLLLLLPVVGNIAAAALDWHRRIKISSIPPAESCQAVVPDAAPLESSSEDVDGLAIDSSLESEYDVSDDDELRECVAEFSNFLSDDCGLDDALKCILQDDLSDADLNVQWDHQLFLSRQPQNSMAASSSRRHLRTDMQDYRRVVMKILKYDGLFLRGEPDELRDDFECVLEAVRNNGLALEFASRRLQSDSEIVCVATHQNPLAVKYSMLDY